MSIEGGRLRFGIFAGNDGIVPRWVTHAANLEEAIATVEGLATDDGQAYFVFDLQEWQTVFLVSEHALTNVKSTPVEPRDPIRV
jgi:hypothetical protein